MKPEFKRLLFAVLLLVLVVQVILVLTRAS